MTTVGETPASAIQSTVERLLLTITTTYGAKQQQQQQPLHQAQSYDVEASSNLRGAVNAHWQSPDLHELLAEFSLKGRRLRDDLGYQTQQEQQQQQQQPPPPQQQTFAEEMYCLKEVMERKA